MAQVQAAQLLARGAQDVWLSGDPQVSFYRSNFKRHVPFATTIERFLVPQDGRIVVNPKSDLLGYTFLTAHDLTTGALVPNADWSNIISTVELVIGNQTIATHDLTYINTIQKVLETDTYSKRAATAGFQSLGFFFDRQYLPIISLKYSSVQINITWSSTNAAAQYNYKCWVYCTHLDEDERQFFTKGKHQMLIPQLQRTIIQTEPTFHGPLKYIAAPCVNYTLVYSPSGPAATGGTITTYSSGGVTYKVHTFTSDGTLDITTGGNFDVLVVGGGGSGSMEYEQNSSGNGGGGGGEVVYSAAYNGVPGSYSVIVGDGGINVGGGFSGTAYNGNVSSIFTFSAAGGIAFSSEDQTGKTGGASGSGNAGGTGSISAGGGGGGAGAAGSNASGTTGGNGGIGLAYDISGTLTYYGGGGGGSAGYLGGGNFGTQGLGGLGGGGNGVKPGDPRPNGQTNTGGGGGAGTNGGTFGTPRNAGYGGSGIVIIRYVI